MDRVHSLVVSGAHGGVTAAQAVSRQDRRVGGSRRCLRGGRLLWMAVGIALAPAGFAQGVTTHWATWTLPTSWPYAMTLAPTAPDFNYYTTGITGSIVNPLTSTAISLTVSGEINRYSSVGSTSLWSGTGYTSAYVANPSTNDARLAQTGYTDPTYQAHTLTFGSSVSDVLMSIYSLGAPTIPSTLTFSQPFQILSSTGGSSFVSAGDAQTGYTLTGYEGRGVIQFLGSYTSLSWNVTAPEVYSAFNIGMTSNPYSAYDPNTLSAYTFPSNVLPPAYSAPVTIPDIVSVNNRVGSTGINLFSNIAGGTTFNNRFDGGTLQLDGSTSTSATFTITGNRGFIDQNGYAGTFAGVISNDGASTGRLVIKNSGTRTGRVILSAANTYSGGTEVQAGATLQIASASALGTGALDLVGTATETATLAVTASTTITNAITVAGDPTFDIASGTTTTISSVIADGASPGDVVKTGLGTLVLTAANTYTGPTTISAGTLALSGSGSIAQSSAVTNNATFDLRQASGNVTLGGTFAQGSGGTLRTTLAPTNNQQVNVAGTASLGGTLDVTAVAGAYRIGRYTLMTSAGLGGSTFSSFSHNLASVTSLGYRLAYDASHVYLDLLANTADTMDSIRRLAGDVNQVYGGQYGLAHLGLSYDCALFDKNNLCLSMGARVTRSRLDGTSDDGVALVAAYRVKPQLRVGGWLDRNVSQRTSLRVTGDNRTPMVGAFAVWNRSPQTGDGWQVKVSGAYGQKDLSLTRTVVGTSERGTGHARLSTLVAEATASYGMTINSRTRISPFAGLRHVRMAHGGYTEAADIFSPLTFASTRQSGQAVIAGVNLQDKPEGPVGLDLSAGVEHYANLRLAQVSASGLDGLSPVALGPALNRNRPYAKASLRYEIDAKQQLSLGLSHSRQFTGPDWVTSLSVRYTVGL